MFDVYCGECTKRVCTESLEESARERGYIHHERRHDADDINITIRPADYLNQKEYRLE